ncbi:MAG TPA: hypothetical protein IAC25_02695 [Candidatus Enterenecus stercoripullorum]|nr:hypothetical protein [Candidatus Enterenecus stercoripullorum]
MKTQRSGRPLWLLCTLALALAAAALRRWQLATAFEGELNLAVPMAPASMALGCTLVIAGAAFGLLAAGQRVVEPPRGEKRKGRWDRALSAPGDPIALAVMVLAAFLMLAAAPLLFQEGWGMWRTFQNSVDKTGNNGVLMLATAATSLVGGVGLLTVAQASYRGRGHGKGAIVLPAVNGCLWLMELYRGHAADPVLWDYVPLLLAVVGSMLMYMDWGGLSSGQPRPRRTLWLAGMTAVLTAVALAGDWQWGEALLLLSQLVTAFVVLSRLPVNLEHPTWAARVSIPEPEKQWLDEGEEEEPSGETPAGEIQEEQPHE